MMYSKWESKQINIIFESDEIFIVDNEELLKQVWINLMDNEIKFSPNGSDITIKIYTKKESVSVNITDKGNGMNKETISHIFDKFYQGNTSHTIK